MHLRIAILSVVLIVGAAGWCFGPTWPRDAAGAVHAVDGTALDAAMLDRFVHERMTALDMPGLSIAVIDGGKVVYHRALGVSDRSTGAKIDEGSIFEAASLSKPVFAYFVLRLVQDGLLELDRPLADYLPMPELAHDPRYRTITARMALAHTTGFPNWRWFDPAPAEWGIERGDMYMKHAPGAFGYSGEGYHYLARVVAHLAGRDLTTLDGLFRREVVEPLGLRHAYFVWDDYLEDHKVVGHRDGEPVGRDWPRSFPDDTPQEFGAAGRLHTEALSYARFLIALMDGEGLAPELLEELFAEQSQVPVDSDMHRHTGTTAWSLGLGMEPTPYGIRYEHGGNNGGYQAGFMFFREPRRGYVFFTNSDRGDAFNRDLEALMTEGRMPAGMGVLRPSP